MKSSNSRDKNIKAPAGPPNARLMKTDVQPPKKEELEKTNYNRPSSGRKIQSTKLLPPKLPSSKKQFIVEDHMTESRITEAKQGLQLLKKKMSSKGLSREKISNGELNQKPITSLKTVKNEQKQYYQNRNANVPPKKAEGSQGKISTGRTTLGKNVNESTKPTSQNEYKQEPVYDYVDKEMEIPIKPKKDFNALLEEELRKQKQQAQTATISKPKAVYNNQLQQYPDESNQRLVQCRHCDRTFSENIISKHEKICQKVFLSKRKAFDSAAHRAVELQGEIPEKPQPQKKTDISKPSKNIQPAVAKKQEEIPKWKAASLAFRANMKQAKGVALSAEQKQASDIAQGLVQCNYCGRKFNDKAATRHIAFCETKSKQLPKTNLRKK